MQEYERCASLKINRDHDWERKKYDSHDGSGGSTDVCRTCGIVKESTWNPYVDTEEYFFKGVLVKSERRD